MSGGVGAPSELQNGVVGFDVKFNRSFSFSFFNMTGRWKIVGSPFNRRTSLLIDARVAMLSTNTMNHHEREATSMYGWMHVICIWIKYLQKNHRSLACFQIFRTMKNQSTFLIHSKTFPSFPMRIIPLPPKRRGRNIRHFISHILFIRRHLMHATIWIEFLR